MSMIDKLFLSSIVICFYGACAAGIVWGREGFVYTIVSCFVLIGAFMVKNIWD